METAYKPNVAKHLEQTLDIHIKQNDKYWNLIEEALLSPMLLDI